MKNKAAVALYHFLITAMVAAFVALTIFAGTPHGLTYDDRQRIGGGDAGEADGVNEVQPLNVLFIFVTLSGIVGATISDVQLANVADMFVTLSGIIGEAVRL